MRRAKPKIALLNIQLRCIELLLLGKQMETLKHLHRRGARECQSQAAGRRMQTILQPMVQNEEIIPQDRARDRSF